MSTKRIIAMDESGGFENVKKEARFLGGFIYNIRNISSDADYESRVAQEERRLREAMEETIRKANTEFQSDLTAAYPGYHFEYPVSLHMSDIKVSNGTDIMGIDRDLMRRVCRFIIYRMMEYLKSAGGYEIFALMAKRVGGNDLEENKDIPKFNVTDMELPGNYYQRLAILATYQFVFYSLDEDIDENIFKFATRTPWVDNEEYARVKGLYQLNNQAGRRNYIHMNSIDMFKTGLAVKVLEKNEEFEKFAVKDSRFEVQEIEYRIGAAISPFYYLTDIVCAYICRACYRKSDYEDYQLKSEHLMSMQDEIRRTYGMTSRFWVYSEADRLFRRAVERFESGDLVQCFDYIYQIMESGDEIANYYVERVIPKLEDFIQKVYFSGDMKYEAERQAFSRRVEALVNEAVTYIRGRGQYKKAGYIAGNLLNIVNAMDISNKSCILYELYDILLCVENHNGSVKESRNYLQKITQYSSCVSHEKYLESVNRAMQIYFNSLMFEEITELYDLLILSAEQMKGSYRDQLSNTQEILRFFELEDKEKRPGNQKEQSANQKGLPENKEELPEIRLKSLGKLYSTQAQAFAFRKEYEKACECFEKAMNEFEKGSADYQITLSYYLHCLISMADYENYRTMSAQYFGTEDVERQIRNLIKGKSFVELFTLRFAIWLWLKSLYVFREKMTGFKRAERRKTIKYVIDTLSSANDERIKAHPWEFIYKYLYLIGKDQELAPELYEKYREWAFAIDKTDHTDSDQEALLAIKYHIRYSLDSDYSEENLAADLKTVALEGLKDLDTLKNTESVVEYVDSKFSYMYR